MTLKDKLDNLENILKSYNRITVALSGGVDSAFLLAFSSKVLGAENVKALTAKGPHLAPDERDYARELCAALGIDHKIIDMDHIMSIISPNPTDRCYHCKKAIFSELKALSDDTLADGTNLDDMNDYRPGHKALAELKIASPLKDAELTKNEIREALEEIAKDVALSKALILTDGTPIWEKPAFACLASRIPYGEEITEAKLSTVYKAEVLLKNLGLKQVRVRHHGNIARIEVPIEERYRFYDEALMDQINTALKGYGFKFVTLDLGGYKMGGGFHDGQKAE